MHVLPQLTELRAFGGEVLQPWSTDSQHRREEISELAGEMETVCLILKKGFQQKVKQIVMKINDGHAWIPLYMIIINRSYRLNNRKLISIIIVERGTRWRIWSGQYATSRNVVLSISEGVIWIFHWLNTSPRNMALGSTQPLTEMSTSSIF
jgi:hypothetical protein